MASDCDAILRDGVFNIVRFENFDNIEQRYFDWIKKLDQQTAQSAAAKGIDLGFEVKGVPVSFGADSDEKAWNTWSKARDSLKVTDFSRQYVMRRFDKTASPDIVNAWKECALAKINATGKAQGLDLQVTRVGPSTFSLRLTFTIEGDLKIKVKRWTVDNATTADKVPKTFQSNSPELLTYTITNPEEDVYASIDTDRGDALAILPRTTPPPKLVPVVMIEGRDYQAKPDVSLEVDIPFDQKVRIWGGRIVAWGGPNCVASCFLQQVAPHVPQEQDSILVAVPGVYIGAAPNPVVSLSGTGPYYGYQVGPFDFQHPAKKGKLKLRLWGGLDNGAILVNSVLHVEYMTLQQVS